MFAQENLSGMHVYLCREEACLTTRVTVPAKAVALANVSIIACHGSKNSPATPMTTTE